MLVRTAPYFRFFTRDGTFVKASVDDGLFQSAHSVTIDSQGFLWVTGSAGHPGVWTFLRRLGQSDVNLRLRIHVLFPDGKPHRAAKRRHNLAPGVSPGSFPAWKQSAGGAIQ